MIPNLRRLSALTLTAALLTPLLAACSSGSARSNGQPSSSPSPAVNAVAGPYFPECGGVGDQTVIKLTGVAGPVTTARTSVGCQWMAGSGVRASVFAFNWFRSSPIGRERKTEELGGATVSDINIDGHNGFVAIRADTKSSFYYCDVAIQYQDDFIDWSISVHTKQSRDLCGIAKVLTQQSIAATK
jgi:hypothetical protein